MQLNTNCGKDDPRCCLVWAGTPVLYPGVCSSFCLEMEMLNQCILWELQVAVGAKFYWTKHIKFPFSTVAWHMAKTWGSARSLPLKQTLPIFKDLSAPFGCNVFNNCNDTSGSFWDGLHRFPPGGFAVVVLQCWPWSINAPWLLFIYCVPTG